MDNHNQETMNRPRSKVSERLLKAMEPKERDSFIASYGRAKKVLARIHDYATKAVNTTSKQLDSPEGFVSPNWQYLVAWEGGYRSAMRVTQDLTRVK